MDLNTNKIDIDMESDNESDMESVMTSVTDLSIYHEFDQMIAELHSIQNTQDHLIQNFHQLSTSIQSVSNNDLNNDKIIITYNKEKVDLEYVLELVYKESMDKIKKEGKMEFSNLLLNYLKDVLL